MPFIYKISNTITGQLYIGQTSKTLLERFDTHLKNSITGTTYLYSAIRKYGSENFQIELVEECSDLLLNEREIFWISELKSLAPTGYNMTAGGTGGDTSSSPKFVEAMKTYHNSKPREEYATYGNAGKKHSLETKTLQAIARQQHWDSLTESEREARRGKVSGNRNGMFGKLPKNTIRIEYQGIEYNSLAEASKILRMSPKRLKKEGRIIT